MRITGGKFRGRRLFVPRGLNVRPTADRIKEAIFGILGPAVEGARVLDLFAGTGALGLESLSRGASLCVLVDSHTRSLAAIRRNIEALGLEDRTRVLKLDLTRGPGRLKNEPKPFDLLFLDPPYGKGLASPALGLLSRMKKAAPGALAVVEHSGNEKLNHLTPGWELIRERVYGQTRISFLLAG